MSDVPNEAQFQEECDRLVLAAQCLAAVRELRRRGKMREIADRLHIKRQAPYTWQRVPAEHVLTVAKISSMTPSQLRPDIYPVSLLQAANS